MRSAGRGGWRGSGWRKPTTGSSSVATPWRRTSRGWMHCSKGSSECRGRRGVGAGAPAASGPARRNDCFNGGTAMTMIKKAQVTTPSDHEVKVVRSFNAPRALVYRAYTEPALVKQWLLGPPGWTMPVCEMDVRVGGQYRWVWRSETDG